MGDRVTTILWDNDGVLVDTEGLYYEATRRILVDFDVSLTPDQYKRYCLHDNRGAWHLAQARGATRKQVEAARGRRNDLYTELIRANPLLIDGVRETLQALHGRFRMGVVTSSMRCHFDAIHESTGLTDFFDFVVTADDVTETKPSPELYEKGLVEADAAPGQAIVVEDSSRGLRAAVAARIPCYVIPTDWTHGSDFSTAAAVLENVLEVQRLLDEPKAPRL